MIFSEAVKTCLVDKYATFSGRATRSEYWFFNLFYVLLIFIITILMAAINTPEFIASIALIIALGLFIPCWSVSFRRLHDTGRSGWWCLLVLIPYIGSLALLIIFCIGSVEDNKYGPKPKTGMIER